MGKFWSERGRKLRIFEGTTSPYGLKKTRRYSFVSSTNHMKALPHVTLASSNPPPSLPNTVLFCTAFHFYTFFLLRTDLFRNEFVCSNLRNSCISVFYFRGQKSENPLKICPVITTLLFVQKNALHLQVYYYHFFLNIKKNSRI